MLNQFSRTELLLGKSAVEKLRHSRVAVFGIGGVGGYVCEALARSGVGALELVDSDTVSLTNINRQIIALHSTIGRQKTEVMAERIRDICPQVDVTVRNCFFLPENADSFPFDRYDYIVDAVDTVAAKLQLAETAYHKHIPIISSMGAGNKLDPTRFRVSDIFDTSVDPLARVMRTQLRKRGVPRLKVVWSDEPPLSVSAEEETAAECPSRRAVPGSTAFVPSVAGLVIAGAVIRDLISEG